MNDLTRGGGKAMSHQEQIEHLRHLVKKTKVAMLTTLDSRQQMRSRPLHTVDTDENGTLWFVVSTLSPKAQEVERHEGRVCLAYANPADQEYVSVSGHADLVNDRAHKERIWNKMLEVWFPKGVDDSNVALLRLRPESAEWWDGAGNVVTQTYAVIKALTTGDKDAFGDNAKVSF